MKQPNLRNLSIRQRQQVLERCTGTSFEHIIHSSYDLSSFEGKNCDTIIGVMQVPLGVAGPLAITRSTSQLEQYWLPLATTEGALVASINRGCKAIAAAGSCQVMVQHVGATRGPCIRVTSQQQAKQIVAWIRKHWQQLQGIIQQQSRYTKLEDMQWWLLGKTLYLRLSFDTGQAMGMNMVTIATEAVLHQINSKFKTTSLVSANICIDKKPAASTSILGRGKKVWAEVEVPADIVKGVLKTTPKEIAQVVRLKQQQGSTLARAGGHNAHAANIGAALYIATGQDPAHVVELSQAITTAECTQSGVYLAVYLPAVMVGTVGGGTRLPAQQEALALLGLHAKDRSSQLAAVVAGAVLAGELSLTAALASQDLGKAHAQLGR